MRINLFIYNEQIIIVSSWLKKIVFIFSVVGVVILGYLNVVLVLGVAK